MGEGYLLDRFKGLLAGSYYCLANFDSIEFVEKKMIKRGLGISREKCLSKCAFCFSKCALSFCDGIFLLDNVPSPHRLEIIVNGLLVGFRV